MLTNVTGSHHMIESAAAAGVRSLVVLSTDKAVYPVNAMNMSKALMEKTAQAFAHNHPALTGADGFLGWHLQIRARAHRSDAELVLCAHDGRPR